MQLVQGKPSGEKAPFLPFKGTRRADNQKARKSKEGEFRH